MKEASGLSAMVRSCMEYISTHIFYKINLESIADDPGYSGTYISRRFKEETGTAPAEVYRRREDTGCQRYSEKRNITISQLSDRLNDSSPDYFSALFKKKKKKINGITRRNIRIQRTD